MRRFSVCLWTALPVSKRLNANQIAFIFFSARIYVIWNELSPDPRGRRAATEKFHFISKFVREEKSRRRFVIHSSIASEEHTFFRRMLRQSAESERCGRQRFFFFQSTRASSAKGEKQNGEEGPKQFPNKTAMHQNTGGNAHRRAIKNDTNMTYAEIHQGKHQHFNEFAKITEDVLRTHAPDICWLARR